MSSSCVVRLGQDLAHLLDRLRRADAGDDVLALRVDEELAVDARLAGGRVAREADAGRRAARPCCRRPSARRSRRCRGRRGSRTSCRYTCARGLSHDSKTARTARRSCSRASCGKSSPGLLLVDALEGLDEPARGRRASRSMSCSTPRSRLRSPSACSKRWPSIPSTTSPYIWISRRYESWAKRALPVARARPATASSFRPRLRIVSIIPGIEIAAPERTETSSGSSVSPKRLPVFSSRCAMCSPISASRPSGASCRAHVRAAGVGRDRESTGYGDAELGHLGQSNTLPSEELAAARRTALRSRTRTWS